MAFGVNSSFGSSGGPTAPTPPRPSRWPPAPTPSPSSARHPTPATASRSSTPSAWSAWRRRPPREPRRCGGRCYDGQTPLLDFNGSGTLTARYLSVPGAIDELLARQTASGVAWYLDDRQGSVKDLINNAGTVLDHVDYTAYGQVQAESAPSQGDRFKYAGMEYDAAINLYYDRRRYYDPATGRFIGQDPSGFAGGDPDLYRYTNNEPSGGIDPTGLLVETVVGVATVAGGTATVAITGTVVVSGVVGQTVVRPLIMDPLWNWLYGNGPYSPPLQPTNGPKPGPSSGPQPDPSPKPAPADPAPKPAPKPGDGSGCPPDVPPSVPFPSNLGPNQSPGPGFQWRGPGAPGSPQGAWYNPQTGEILWNDMNHPPGINSHWDYWKKGCGGKFRWFPD